MRCDQAVLSAALAAIGGDRRMQRHELRDLQQALHDLEITLITCAVERYQGVIDQAPRVARGRRAAMFNDLAHGEGLPFVGGADDT
jgi:hypothetical protein